MIALLLALVACAPTPLVRGAAPIPAGMVQTEVRGQFPAPIPGFAARLGLTDDADLAATWLPAVGAAADLRYRFWTDGTRHLAYIPGFSVEADVGDPRVLDSELRAAVVFEWRPKRPISLSSEARITLGQQWYRDRGPPVVRGLITRFIPAIGARCEYRPRRFSIAMSGIVGWDAVRAGDRFVGNVGLDTAFLFGRWPERRQRD